MTSVAIPIAEFKFPTALFGILVPFYFATGLLSKKISKTLGFHGTWPNQHGTSETNGTPMKGMSVAKNLVELQNST